MSEQAWTSTKATATECSMCFTRLVFTFFLAVLIGRLGNEGKWMDYLMIQVPFLFTQTSGVFICGEASAWSHNSFLQFYFVIILIYERLNLLSCHSRLEIETWVLRDFNDLQAGTVLTFPKFTIHRIKFNFQLISTMKPNIGELACDDYRKNIWLSSTNVEWNLNEMLEIENEFFCWLHFLISFNFESSKNPPWDCFTFCNYLKTIFRFHEKKKFLITGFEWKLANESDLIKEL